MARFGKVLVAYRSPDSEFCVNVRLRVPTLILVLIATCLSGIACADPFYLAKVKPIFRQRCYACHGGLKQESNLRLDTANEIRRGGDSGAAIQIGKAESSLLIERVSTKDITQRMPPEHLGEPLTDAEIAILKKWIDRGAKGPANEQPEAAAKDHWAFQRVTRPAVPKLTGPFAAWIRNPVDSFVAARHVQQKLTPQPEASRLLLIRRLYVDLIGVPPNAEELQELLADESPDWYEVLVRQLLNDPRYGERWGRHWMDVWRYSDWWGLGQQLRFSQKHIWHWRDWIIESLNDDLPYDEMVRQMLAADELYPNDLGKLRATGYLARNWFIFNRPQWMEGVVEHVGKGFLGLTMNCAKCHDHKYDPIEQTDFYRMRAFFEPYHVRTDVLPGQMDLAKDGIPRAFDGLLDQPTYVYIRGDEKRPDKNRAVTPGVPELLRFADLEISPIDLPSTAWQPGRRAWVVDGHIAQAKKRLEDFRKQATATASRVKQLEAEAKKELANKKGSANKAESNPRDEPEQKQATTEPLQARQILVHDQFETLNEKHWKLIGGQWKHSPGKLEQLMDGPQQAKLQWIGTPPSMPGLPKENKTTSGTLPRDFDITYRFVIKGGSRWRSVGISFDIGPDPQATDYSHQFVYVSAYTRGPKVHAAFRRGTQDVYPQGTAVRSYPIKSGEEITFRVQTKGQLVNAFVNGQLVIAHRMQLARRDGSLQFMTFDAITEIREIKIAALPKKQRLKEPSAFSTTPKSDSKPPIETLATAQAKLTQLTASINLAQAEITSLLARKHFYQASKDSPTTESGPSPSAEFLAAVKAARSVSAAKAKLQEATAQFELALAQAEEDAGKTAAAKAKLQQATAAIKAAKELARTRISSADKLDELVGAKWTPTRFFSSGRDDAEVKFPSTSTGRRSALARWITDKRNPLTARVAVNHIWMRHMGRPIVPTVFDFGRNGSPPSHPKLLDWLAWKLMQSDWSMKEIHRIIVESSVYRLSSSERNAESNRQRDRNNEFWWRRSPIRIESQVVRDSLLSLAKVLDLTRGGPPIPAAMQPGSRRRSLYFFHSNNDQNLFLRMFDEARVTDCYRRDTSIIPQQALALTNSALAFDSATAIAKAIGTDQAKMDDRKFTRRAFQTILAIDPNAAELNASLEALKQWSEDSGASALTGREHLVWVLINHNDFVTIR